MRNLLLLMVIVIAISISTARFGIHRNGFTFLKQTNTSLQFEDQWFDQILDHFTAKNNSKWKQRYFINWEYYERSGPIFLILSGESVMGPEPMTSSSCIEYGKRHKALFIQLEHRFYGKSRSTADITIENLKYLSSEQALADAAHFIIEFNRRYQIPNGTKWFAFGGSYSGNLVAWFRLKYPHLVYAAVASSAPVLAQVDFQDYLVVMENSLMRYSKSCVKAIEDASTQISIMLRHPIGRKGLFQKFKLCDPLDSIKKIDIINFYSILSNYISDVVQYNKDNRFSKIIRNYTIDFTCNILLNERLGTPVDRLAEFITKILNVYELPCLDYKYDSSIAELRNFSRSDLSDTMWTYQSCAEFGYFQSSTARPRLFHGDVFPLDYFIRYCEDVFGPKFNLHYVTSAVNRTNAFYGGKDISTRVTNVVFINGNIDPWHALGITNSSNPLAPAIFIDGIAHVADYYGSSKNDLPQLTKARQRIQTIIDKWVNEKQCVHY